MDFLALDFETASGNANSACQLGLVLVQDSEIIHEACWLIRPPRLYFAARNVAIHGIRPQHVADAPTMEQLWGELAEMVDGRVLLAHNARFDISVLIASLAAYDLACPQLEFSCTRILARAVWPGRGRYGLKPLAQSFGICFRHHDALEDARCCAKIALAAADATGQDSLEKIETSLRIRRGQYANGSIKGPITIGRRRRIGASGTRQSTDKWGFPDARATRIAALDPSVVIAASCDSLPLAGKNIVMLGPLRGLTMAATLNLIKDLGGNCQTRITSTTDFVVACGTTLAQASNVVCESLADYESRDEQSAVSGCVRFDSTSMQGIRLLSERQFRALLPGGKSSLW